MKGKKKIAQVRVGLRQLKRVTKILGFLNVLDRLRMHCEVNVIRPVACHMQRQIPVNSRQTQ